MVLIFAISLGFAFHIAYNTEAANRIDNLIKVLQAVVATLGGLVGSIVGYYFGESAAKGARTQDTNTTRLQNLNPPVQNEGPIDDITPVADN